MQIESVSFKNFKVLRDTTLPLSRMTLLIGPNGSGKSTAFEGLELFRMAAIGRNGNDPARYRSIGCRPEDEPTVTVNWLSKPEGRCSELRIGSPIGEFIRHRGMTAIQLPSATHIEALARIRQFAFEARWLKQTDPLDPSVEISREGRGLAVVLDQLRDNHPERFQRFNEELARWFPEYDQVVFQTPQTGHRGLALHVKGGAERIQAEHLSEGTLLALGLLTLAHLPDPPTFVCLEEPDRGVHPRLLRNIHDALTRLAFPKEAGDDRPPVQVIATTHSPYFLDLFRDHPEDVVIAERENGEAKFHRLTDMPDLAAILEDASLGEIWYTGVLGGVPTTK